MEFTDTEITEGDYSGADIAHSDLARCRFVGVRFAGADLSESRIFDVSFVRCQFSGADLSQSTLRGVTFTDCRADDVNFRMTQLRDVFFGECALGKADFIGAKLESVGFADSDCRGVDMSNVIATNVDLRGARLDGLRGLASLRGATIGSDQLVGLALELALALGLVVTPPDG